MGRIHRVRSCISMPGRITIERLLAIVLARLLGSFSLLCVINFKLVAIDQALMMLR